MPRRGRRPMPPQPTAAYLILGAMLFSLMCVGIPEAAGIITPSSAVLTLPSLLPTATGARPHPPTPSPLRQRGEQAIRLPSPSQWGGAGGGAPASAQHARQYLVEHPLQLSELVPAGDAQRHLA